MFGSARCIVRGTWREGLASSLAVDLGHSSTFHGSGLGAIELQVFRKSCVGRGADEQPQAGGVALLVCLVHSLGFTVDRIVHALVQSFEFGASAGCV